MVSDVVDPQPIEESLEPPLQFGDPRLQGRGGGHRLGGGGLIVEVVERAGLPEGPASFWGFVLNVEDLDAAAALIGPDGIGEVKDAVQPGRRIATVRAELGLGLPVALMTP